jgi:hypothetical protein
VYSASQNWLASLDDSFTTTSTVINPRQTDDQRH